MSPATSQRATKARYDTPSSGASLTTDRFLPALLALFVGSGLCALIYEVVWFQLLELVIGSSAISLGVLLATYMGGLFLGSLAFPRLAAATRQHPLRVYALLELAIGACGLVVFVLVPLVSHVYTASTGHGFLGIALRAVVCAVCLLPPTMLMGATLPAASRWVESTPSGVSWIGLLYAGNTVGAVLGSVLAGFYLLRVYDALTTTLVAVVINATIGALALVLSRRAPALLSPVERERDAAGPPPRPWAVYTTIALSGTSALGAEVVWTRLLSLMLGATTYTFSMILAVFLAGLGLGGAAGASIARSVKRPRLALGWCQLLQVGAVAWAATMIAASLPYWPVNPALATSPWFTFQLDVTRCLWVVMPAALLWGASFPLALASAATPNEDPARLVSGVYASNTVGAIIGSLGFSLLVVPAWGTQHAQQILITLAAVSALVVFLSALRGRPARNELPNEHRRRFALGALVPAGLAVVATLLLVPRTPAVPGLLVAYGRYMVTWLNQISVLYVGEGMNSSIAVSTLNSNGATQFHVAGKVEASSLPQDMRLQRMLAHLPALVHPAPKSVLVVGFGAGVTAGSFVPYPTVQRLAICEIEPLIPKVISTYFTRANNDVVHDRRTQIYYDDARSFILTTKEKFDVITSDPIHPWVKGAATLYTREYFEAVRAHLNPGGVVTQWVPLYESTPEAVKSEIATFLEVFPNGTVWANNIENAGYDVVLMGQVEPTKIDLRALMTRMSDARYRPVMQSLQEVGFDSPVTLFSTYAGNAPALTPWLRDATINRDRNLRLQYLAAAGANLDQSRQIYEQIASFRAFPDSLFTPDPFAQAMMREAMHFPVGP
jgi:spermidine synthase